MLDVDVIFRLVGQLKKKLLFILSHTEDDKILFLSFIEISVEEKKIYSMWKSMIQCLSSYVLLIATML